MTYLSVSLNIENEIKTKLESYTSAPFLFVGSGLSRRYYDLPNWPGLLNELCELTDISYGEIRSLGDGDLSKSATEIARRIHPLWWNDSRFSGSREKYESIAEKIEKMH